MIKCKKILLALVVGVFACSVLQAKSELAEKVDLNLIKTKKERNVACKKEIGKLIGNATLLDKVDPRNEYKGEVHDRFSLLHGWYYDDARTPYCDFLEVLKEGENNIVKGCYYGVDVKYNFKYDKQGRVLQYARLCSQQPAIVKVEGKEERHRHNDEWVVGKEITVWNIMDIGDSGSRDRFRDEGIYYQESDISTTKVVVAGCQSTPVDCGGPNKGWDVPYKTVVTTDIGKQAIAKTNK